MKLLQPLFALLGAAYAAGQFLQERRRLAAMEAMSGREAKAYYEAFRRRHDLALTIVTAVFALGAVGMLGYSLLR